MQKISRALLDKAIKPYASQGKTLEIGSYGSPKYGLYFPNKTGIDIRPGPGVDKIASVYSLPFPDNEFDVVLCISVLEHLEEPSKAIEEMRRVLKPDGIIIVSVPFMFPIHDAPDDYWRFTKFGLELLFRDWTITESKAEANTQSSLAVLLQRIGFQTDTKARPFTKGIIYLFSWMAYKMPDIFKTVFGDIRKSYVTPAAFASANFLVAKPNK